MEFDPILLAPRRAQSVAQGFWPDRTINDELDACVASCPDQLALTAVQGETGATTRFTFADFRLLQPKVSILLGVADTIALEYDVAMVRRR